MAISGDYLVVGAHMDDTRGNEAGAAYVFEHTGSGWTEAANLMASDAQAGAGFGKSVAMSGNYLVVGTEIESAYVFERKTTGWEQVRKLPDSEPERWDWFGESVAIDGRYVAVGAAGDDTRGSEAGSVYVFERTVEGWQQVQKVMASDAKTNAMFGVSVALSGRDLGVGDMTQGGACYVFSPEI